MPEPAPGDVQRTVEIPPGAVPGAASAVAHSLRTLLAQADHFDRPSFLAMLRADQRKRWQRGERILVETYLAQVPSIAADTEALLDLIYSEVVTRGDLGESPRLDEYVIRFSQHEAALRRQFAINDVLGDGSLLDLSTADLPLPQPEPGQTQALVLPVHSGNTHDAADSLRVPAHRTVADGVPPTADSRHELALLPSVPGYILLEELGRGGMGVVYKARQIALKRTVALKMILAGAHAGPQERSRIQAEAEAVAKLHHPNIVQIYEVGEHQRLPYLALEYVDGGGLDRKLSGTPLPPGEGAEIVLQLSQAMDYAHAQGVVHRDLKPANVLLTKVSTQGSSWRKRPGSGSHRRGEASTKLPPESLMPVPKITDFGLAKQDGSDANTRTGAVVGTPSYMAPEQASGKRRQVGPPADVYALGAILYECLTGRPPFRAATPVDTVLQVLSEEPVPPTRLNPRVPADLETICLKCLQKEPHKRYDGAAALADDLEAFLAGEPITARPVSRTERLVKWVRRNPRIAGLWTALVGLFWMSFVVVTCFWLNAVDARDAERQALAAEKQEKELKNAALEQSQETLYFNRIALADREWWANNVPGVEELLDHYPPARGGWEWHYLKRLCHTDLLTVPGQQCAAFSPDGKWLATSGDSKAALHDGAVVQLWNADTGKSWLMLAGHKGRVNHIAFAPAGKLLASAAEDKAVKLWDPATGEEVATLDGHEDPVLQVSFSADGKLLASASNNDAVLVWDVATRKLLHRVAGDSTAAFSPDGKLLATAAGDSDVKLWDPATGRELRLLPGPDGAGHVNSVAFSPDGRWLLTGGDEGVLRIWNVALAQERRMIPTHAGRVARVAFSPDGRRLAAASGDPTATGGLKLWDVATGQELRAYRWPTKGGTDVAFHPDGRRLAAADAEVVKLWDGTSDQESRTLRGHTAAVQTVAFSPDGRRVASGDEDGSVFLWDAATGRALAKQKEHPRGVWAVAFSPDGAWLASAGDDRTVLLRDPHTGQKRRLLQHGGAVLALAFSPDGRQLAAASRGDDLVNIWNLASGALVRSIAAPQITRLAYRPDGTRLVGIGQFEVHVWDPATGQEVLMLDRERVPFSSVAYSPDGRRLLTTGGNTECRQAKVWDAETGACLLTIAGRGHRVSQAAYSPDGRRVAVAGWDHTVKLWDPRTGQDVLTLRGHGGRVTGVAFSPNGQRIASASTDQTVRIWDATPLPPGRAP